MSWIIKIAPALLVATQAASQPTVSDSSINSDAPYSDLSAEDEQKLLKNVTQFVTRWYEERRPLSPETYFFTEGKEQTVISSIIMRQLMSRGADSSFDSTLDDMLQNSAEAISKDWQYPLQLVPADMMTVGHVDCEIDYQCLCKPEWSYTPALEFLNDPDLLTRENLEHILNAPQGQFYDCYNKINSLDGFREELRCRFLSEVEPQKLRGSGTILASSYLVESAARVRRSDLKPIGRASKFVRPVAALIDDKWVPFTESWDEPGVRCAVSRVFDNPVLEVSTCGGDEACVSDAVNHFLSTVDKFLSNEPISARRDLSEPALPGERYYVRNYERSHILGSPYYESSQYILSWFKNDAGELAPPGVYAFSRGDAAHFGRYILVVIRHSLSVRAGRTGTYPEANSIQYAAYEKAVGGAVVDAVEESCSVVGGTFTDNVCYLTRR